MKLIRHWSKVVSFITALAVVAGMSSILPPVITGVLKSNAQATSQTTFYFKNDTATTASYWGVTGPNNDESSDVAEVTVTGATTAISQHPISGALTPGAAADSVVGTSTTDANADLVWYRTFLMPLASGTQFTSSTTFQVGASFDESSTNANAMPRAFIYVYDSVSDSRVKTLAGPTQHGTEAGTGDQGKVWSITNGVGIVSYTTDNNDFLAVEIWVNFDNTRTTAYTCTFWWGGNTAVADGTTNTDPASYVTIGGTTVDTFDPLWFRETTSPYEPAPNEHQTGDSFADGTWAGRKSSTTAGSSGETHNESGVSGLYRLNSFVSAPLVAQTIPAGNWVIQLHGHRASTGTCIPRYMIYVWKNDDSGIRGTPVSVRNASTGFGSATTNRQVEEAVSGSSVTVLAGDRLVVDVEATVTGTIPQCNFSFGYPATPSSSNAHSAILPPMNYASSPAPVAYANQLYDQTHFKFDEDNDGETHAGGWTDKNGATTEDDTTVNYDEDSNFRLRVQIRNQGNEGVDTLTPKLHYRVSPSGTWTEATTSSTDVQIVASASFSEPTATTRQLTDLTGDNYVFASGWMEENSSPAGDTAMVPGAFTEYEWSLIGNTANTYDFKVTDNGTDFGFYTKTPTVTIDAGASYTPDQQDWRWFDAENDTDANLDTTNGTDLSAGDALANENSTPSSPYRIVYPTNIFKLRVKVGETAGVSGTNVKYKLQYDTKPDFTTVKELGADDDASATWIYDSDNSDGYVDDNAIGTTKLSGSPSAGRHNEDAGVGAGQGSTFDPAASTTYEHEFVIQLNTTIATFPPVVNTVYYFRLMYAVDSSGAPPGAWTEVPLGGGETAISIRTATAFDLEASAIPSDVEIGNYQQGGSGIKSYTFIGGEEVAFWDKRASGTYDVTVSAMTMPKNGGGTPISGTDITWQSPGPGQGGDVLNGAFASDKTGMTGQEGATLDQDINAYSVASSSQGKGGFYYLPTMIFSNLESYETGTYTGTLTVTII